MLTYLYDLDICSPNYQLPSRFVPNLKFCLVSLNWSPVLHSLTYFSNLQLSQTFTINWQCHC
jgi:hypothetical protein